MSTSSAYDLWRQAGGGTAAYDRAEYQRLALEHGLLIPLAPGEEAEPLPCGWPGKRRVRVEIDPNVRTPEGWTYTSAGSADGPLAAGDRVILFESENQIEWDGTVARVDEARQLAYFDVDWRSLRNMP